MLPITSTEARVLSVLEAEALSVAQIANASGTSDFVTRQATASLVEKGMARRVGAGFRRHDGRGRAGRPAAQRRVGDYREHGLTLLLGDAEERLRDVATGSQDIVVTSCPYYRERDYGSKEQLGWEPTPADFVSRLLRTLKEGARTMADHALFFLNFDDHVQGGKLSCLDSQLLVRLEEVGLEKHREVVWHKGGLPNGTDRGLAHVYEKIFILRKQSCTHFWDALKAQQAALKGGLRRMTDVWEITCAKRVPEGGLAHAARFPQELVERCLDVATSERGYCRSCGKPFMRKIVREKPTSWQKNGGAASKVKLRKKQKGLTWKADCGNNKGGAFESGGLTSRGWRADCSCGAPARPARVLDPFCGSGTTGIVAGRRGMSFTGVDVNADCLESSAVSIRRAQLEGRKDK